MDINIGFILWFSLSCSQNRGGGIRHLTRSELLGTIAVAFLFLLFIAYFISRERFIYYWDYSGYWNMALQGASKLTDQPLQVLPELYHAVNTQEYNPWIAYMVSLPLKILGGGYVSYILILYVMFVIPTVGSLGLLIKKLMNDYDLKAVHLSLIVSGLLGFTWVLMPMLLGYPGAAACLCVVSCLWISFHEPVADLRLKEIVVLSLSLISGAIVRRYFSFWIMGYVIGIIIYSFIGWLQAGHSFRLFMSYTKKFLLLGMISLAILMLPFRGFFLMSLKNNYKNAYSAYSYSGLIGKYGDIYHHIGNIIFISLILIIVLFLVYKKFHKILGFFIGSFLTMSFTFFQIQSLGIQHYYIFLIPLLIILFLGASLIWKMKKVRWLSIIFMAGYALNFCYVFTGSIFPHWNAVTVFQYDRYYPRMRTDMDQVIALRNYLEDVSEGRLIYIIPGSSILNEEIISMSYLPDDIGVNLARSAQVDLRDGFNAEFFDSEFIVSAEPLQIHLAPDKQQIIAVLTEEMNNPASLIRQNYEKLDTFILGDEVKATVYRKIHEFKKEEINYVMNRFEAIYPDYPELFKNRLVNYEDGK